MKAALSLSGGSTGNGGSQADLDRVYMERALELAAQAAGKTTPNPCVGCVLVKNGAIVGEGWHERAGEPHAEVHALQRAGDRCEGATAYVSLEPCNHFGRTPPCTHALLQHGVSRVVAGMVDPDPRVSVAYLRGKGVAAEIIADRAMNRACKSLNAPFVHRIMYKRAHAVVWAALDAAHGSLVDPLVTDVDVEAVHRVVPEANAVVMGAERFLRLDPRDVVKWPAHLAVAVDGGEAGGGGGGGGRGGGRGAGGSA
jgi:diaminohydroxyphosphoribosylaminopyrimidine deaminase/5-amino-6-(5-phosphoribosylamino)uracil reductase